MPLLSLFGYFYSVKADMKKSIAKKHTESILFWMNRRRQLLNLMPGSIWENQIETLKTAENPTPAISASEGIDL